MLSPGYETRETTTQTTIVRGTTGRAAMVGKFVWGPINTITQVTDEVELKDRFGTPDYLTAPYFISAANFLNVGNDLRLVRVIDKKNAKNASPLSNTINYNVTAGGTGYKEGEVVNVKYKETVLPEKGRIVKVDEDGRIEKVYIPSKSIVEILKTNGTYPTIGSDFKLDFTTSSGLQGNVTLTSVNTDSKILIEDESVAKETIEQSDFMDELSGYGLPAIVGLYAGELGNTITVEIVSKDNFEEQTITVYPDGDKTQSSARGLVQYAPQTDDEYVFIVRKSGVVVERFTLSTKKGTRDVYGNNIFMDDFFTNGGSRYIYCTTTNFPKGFTGLIRLGGGLSSNNTVESGELMQGWDLFADKETVHVTLLIAGAVAAESVEIASTVQKHVAFIADQRKDCVAFISPPKDLIVNIPLATAIDNIEAWRKGKTTGGEVVDDNFAYDTSYQFIDGNFKYQYDKYNDVRRWVPLAADIAGRAVHTDNVDNVWKSIAGYRRGAIPNVDKLAIEPKKPHRDRLYTIAINPVYNDGGYFLLGDKTGTNVPTPFDRINVRRLFNKLKYEIGETSKYNLFENNTNFTRSAFRMECYNYLDNIKNLGGIVDFRVVCDTTNNTQAVIDRNEFVAQFYIKPPRSINYIMLEFTATESGADFDELIGPSKLN